MTLQLGMVRPGTTLYIPFATYAGATGASITLTGLAVTDIEIYRNGSVTQRASDTGYTLLDTDGIDFDGITGIHGFSIDLSSNATADFFTAGAQYWVVVSAVTIDGQTVNFIAATFSIGYADALINTTIATLASQTSFTLTAGPAEDDALNGCRIVIHDIASAVQLGTAYVSDYTGSTRTVTLAAGTTFTAAAGDNISIFTPALLPTVAGRTLDVSSGGEAGLDWANIGSPTTAQNLSGTNIDTDQVVASVTGAVGSVTGNVGGNVVGSVASVTAQVTANVTAISGDTAAADNAEAFFDGTGYAGTGNTIPTVTTVGTVNALAANSVTAAALAADAAAEIADAVWDEDATGHQTQGTFGQAIGDPGADADTIWALVNTNLNATVSSRASQTSVDDIPTNAELAARTLAAADYATAAGVSAVETDTQDIQGRLPAALVSGRMDSSVGAMAANTLTASALAADAVTEIQSGLSTLTPAQVNTEADAALADVGLTTTITGRIDAAVSTRLATAGYTAPDNAGIAAILVDTDTTIPAILTTVLSDLAAVEALVDDLESRLTAPRAAALDNLDATVSSRLASASYTTPPTATQNADALLTRDMGAPTGEAARSVLNALRAIRNRVAVAAGTMTVYEEDDTTPAWTAVVTTDAAAEPVTEINP